MQVLVTSVKISSTSINLYKSLLCRRALQREIDLASWGARGAARPQIDVDDRYFYQGPICTSLTLRIGQSHNATHVTKL